jgi:site-specific recombinase XerD
MPILMVRSSEMNGQSDANNDNNHILDDKKVQDWLSSIQNTNTREVYRIHIRTFFTWLGQSPSDFLREVDEDSRKDLTEKRNLARSKLIEFYNYATTEMPRRGPDRKVVGKGLSYNGTMTIMGAVRSLLNEYGFTVKFQRRHMPKPKGRNPCERIRLNVAQVRSILTNARLPRDRAIIIVLAQSGMDLNTLVNMKYKTVQAALEKEETPVMLELFRQKAAQPYFSFMGSEGIEALRAYLQDLGQRGIELKPDDPLWLTEKKREPMTEYNVQKVLRICAEKAGLINGEDRYNLAGGHAIREFFSSALTEARVPKTYIDEMLGHTLNGIDSAYFKGSPDAIRSEYARAYESLTLMPQGLQNGQLRAKIDEELDKRTDGLLRKNADLENRLMALISSEEVTKKFLEGLNERIAKLEKVIELSKARS